MVHLFLGHVVYEGTSTAAVFLYSYRVRRRLWNVFCPDLIVHCRRHRMPLVSCVFVLVVSLPLAQVIIDERDEYMYEALQKACVELASKDQSGKAEGQVVRGRTGCPN